MKKTTPEIPQSFLRWLASAFDTSTTGGASARKLSAFVIMACVVLTHVAWLQYAFRKDDFALMPEILVIDYSFVAALLGLTTYQYIKTQQRADQPIAPSADPPNQP